MLLSAGFSNSADQQLRELVRRHIRGRPRRSSGRHGGPAVPRQSPYSTGAVATKTETNSTELTRPRDRPRAAPQLQRGNLLHSADNLRRSGERRQLRRRRYPPRPGPALRMDRRHVPRPVAAESDVKHAPHVAGAPAPTKIRGSRSAATPRSYRSTSVPWKPYTAERRCLGAGGWPCCSTSPASTSTADWVNENIARNEIIEGEGGAI